jgi:hypothetical protein
VDCREDLTAITDSHAPAITPSDAQAPPPSSAVDELVGSPEIVVIHKGEPLAASISRSAVPSGRQSARRAVPDHSNAFVCNRVEHRSRIVRRGLVDDNDFDVALGQYAAQRQCQESAAITRRHHHRYVHMTLNNDPLAAGPVS